MRAFAAAVGLCVAVGYVAVREFPYTGAAIAADRVHLVHVCLPQKDQSRHARGETLPVRMVRTERFVAADVSPAKQARENRKPKKRR